jgi:hypothetical protein
MSIILFPNLYEKEKWHTIKDFTLRCTIQNDYGVLHSVASGSDKSKFDSLLKYLMKFKYGVSLNSLTIALFIA